MLFQLFYTFAKIGLFTFGGGYAMIALIQDECVEKKKWITEDEFATVISIAESTPGPIAINCATYTGYMRAGIKGSMAATFGVVLPSFVIIYCISVFFDNLLDIAIVASAFQGIKIAVGILILRAGCNMLKKMKRKFVPIFIFTCVFAAMLAINYFALNFSTVYLILLSGVLGFVFYKVRQIHDGKKVKA